MSKQRTPEEIHQYLKKLQARTGQSLFNLDTPEQEQVILRPDSSISRSKFKKHPLLNNAYLAHPDTIRAVRKDIFFHGGFEDLEFNTQCPKCNQNFDLQFWTMCPFCCAAPSE